MDTTLQIGHNSKKFISLQRANIFWKHYMKIQFVLCTLRHLKIILNVYAFVKVSPKAGITRPKSEVTTNVEKTSLTTCRFKK